MLDARGGLLFGGLEICRGARAVHFRLFSLCYPVLALSHLPSFTGRAESPAALQLPLLSLLWTILCKLYRCLWILDHGQVGRFVQETALAVILLRGDARDFSEQK